MLCVDWAIFRAIWPVVRDGNCSDVDADEYTSSAIANMRRSRSFDCIKRRKRKFWNYGDNYEWAVGVFDVRHNDGKFTARRVVRDRYTTIIFRPIYTVLAREQCCNGVMVCR